MNNLDPQVAERPEDLVVYGGIGKAARNWECFDAIVAALNFANWTTTKPLLVQSGKPVGVFKTHADAPRVLIANSNLVPAWANWEHFRELDRKGLMMYGQMTAGSWIYIGSQGIVQGTYETFVEMGRQHYDGDLGGQMDPDRRALAAWAARSRWRRPWPAHRCLPSSVSPIVSTSGSRPVIIDKRRRGRSTRPLAMIEEAVAASVRPISIGLLGNAALNVLPGNVLQRGIRPDAADRPDLGTRSGQRLFAQPAGQCTKMARAAARV